MPVGAWPRTLYAALAALAVVTLVNGVRTGVDRWPSDSEKPAAAGGPCLSPAQDSVPQLTRLPAERSAPTRLEALAFHLQRSDPPRMEIAAKLSEPPPDGTIVQMLERADPNTVDSTPGHNPGNGRYYPRPSIRTVGSCVYVPENQIGYAGFAGMRLRYVVVLLPERFASSIVTDSQAADGLSGQDLSRYSLTQLAYFEFRV
ncbi:hypothetical protein [Cryptosporangium aurantiacum]|uniref:hypothetical protein n=1 Tax=Cryptosporangium aurantiacum TaxID=134849 RepID=UPI000932E793|nr:hypothetical protein [Cryptosporangium aurantiacum]